MSVSSSCSRYTVVLAAGVFCLVSSAFGIFALVNTVERRGALIGYVIMILLVVMLEISLGAMLWFSTLQMRDFMDKRWQSAFSTDQIAAFQEKVNFFCLGILNPAVIFFVGGWGG